MSNKRAASAAKTPGRKTTSTRSSATNDDEPSSIVDDESSISEMSDTSTMSLRLPSIQGVAGKDRTQSAPIESKLKMEDRLKAVPYYHGMLPRRDIEPLLLKKGDFLLRKTESKEGGEQRFTISVMWDDGVKHFLVRTTKQRRYFLEKNCFDTVTDLIDYHQYSKVPLLASSTALLKKAIRRPEWQLTHDQLKTGKPLGEGAYGEVFLATLVVEGAQEQRVAVKTMRALSSTREEKVKFLKEARLMRSYRHPNLVEMIGVAVQEEPLMIVMEFCPGGDLQSYLKSKGAEIAEKKRIRFCLEAAEGMAYLEKEGLIHRDIAARNCLIGKKDEVKIADFGLSRQMSTFKETRPKRVPIRWLAPETLRERIYTTKTDVWSFGIMMWEIFNNGIDPYPGLNNKEVREKVVKEQYRMTIGDNVPASSATIMSRCWLENATERPSFKDIRDATKKAL